MKCLWLTCNVEIPPQRGCCFAHWKMVPQDLRLRFVVAKGEERKKISAKITARSQGESPAVKTKATIV
jgi:hypothetical protein